MSGAWREPSPGWLLHTFPHLPSRQQRGLDLSTSRGRGRPPAFPLLFRRLSSGELRGPSDAAPSPQKEHPHQKQVGTEGTGGGAPGGGAAAERTVGRQGAGGSDRGLPSPGDAGLGFAQGERALVMSSQNSESQAQPSAPHGVRTPHSLHQASAGHSLAAGRRRHLAGLRGEQTWAPL